MSHHRHCHTDKFAATYAGLRADFLTEDHHERVNTGHWQSVSGTPHAQTREIAHITMTMDIRPTAGSWASFIEPNLPWAEAHFQERISGQPLNPGEEFKNWPWYRGGVEDHKASGKFSHTYMERFWPRFTKYPDPPANELEKIQRYDSGNEGIRYRYGDLSDLITLLWNHPHTRQAYLPIWFPEDLGAIAHDQRVPCTLGYHLMLRDDKLHCFYPMRSVDFVRYLKDDLYMAGRLVQHVIQWLQDMERNARADGGSGLLRNWESVTPGRLEFFASSLHIFEGDIAKLHREHDEWAKAYVMEGKP